MKTLNFKNKEGVSLNFSGELIAEAQDTHQVERRLPPNTEDVQLYETEGGQFILIQNFKMHDFPQRHSSLYFGETRLKLLANVPYPTPVIKHVLTGEAYDSNFSATVVYHRLSQIYATQNQS